MATITVSVTPTAAAASVSLGVDHVVEVAVAAVVLPLRATDPTLGGPFATGIAAADIFPPIGALSLGGVVGVISLGGNIQRPAVTTRGIEVVAVLGISSLGYAGWTGIEAVSSVGGTLRVVRGIASDPGVLGTASLGYGDVVTRGIGVKGIVVVAYIAPVPLGGGELLTLTAMAGTDPAAFAPADCGGSLSMVTYPALSSVFPVTGGRAPLPWLVTGPDVSALSDLVVRDYYGPNLLLEPGFDVWIPAFVDQVVPNGSFELHTGDDFDDWVEVALGSSTITADVGGGYGGGDCVKFTIDGSNSAVTMRSPLAIDDPAGLYTITFWAKIDSVVGTEHLKLFLGAETNPVAWWDVALTASWKQFTANLTSEAGTNFTIQRGADGAGRTMWVDEVTCVKVPVPLGWTPGYQASVGIVAESVAGGQARFRGNGTLRSSLTQNVLVTGAWHRLSYTVVENASAQPLVSNLDLTDGVAAAIPLETSVGRHTVEFRAYSAQFKVRTRTAVGIIDVTLDALDLRVSPGNFMLRKLNEPFRMSPDYVAVAGDGLQELGAKPGYLGMLVEVPFGAGTQRIYRFRKPELKEVIVQKGQWS